MKRWAVPALLLTIAVALFLRGGDLALRPLHNDEAINAFKLQKLWHGEGYRYDPEEFHGPTLYYLSLPVLRVATWFRPDQPDEAVMRWVPVLFGVGLILLLPLLADGLGWGPALAAGWFTAVSPAFVYYSRYFIHEMPLVFFSFLAIGALWRYLRKPGMGWAILFGAAVGMMYATKETFVFSLGAMGLAWLGTRRLQGSPHDPRTARREPGDETLLHVGQSLVGGGKARGGSWRHAAAAIGAGLAVTVTLYTSFFTHWRGVGDAIRTYIIWLERAGGASPHVHPWSFYLGRLAWFHPRGSPVWSEAAILAMAAVGGAAVWRGRGATAGGRWLGCFLAIYTLVLTAVYAAIPYKTPWCLLGFHHGIILLAGIGAASLVTWRQGVAWRVGTVLAVAAASAHLAGQSWRATHEFAADFRNPYVYGHTSADIVNLLEQVNEIASVAPAGRGMEMRVMAPDHGYWPLPWSLRHFEKVGWWDRVPDADFAPVMIVASKLNAGLEEKSNRAWLMVGLFELRPRFFVELYVEAKLWDRFLAARRAARDE